MNKHSYKIDNEEVLSSDVADFFKNFGDTSRIRILNMLWKGEANVSSIAEKLNMSQSSVSHQLRVLKSSKLISSRPEGKNIYYTLCDDHVAKILECAITHLEEFVVNNK